MDDGFAGQFFSAVWPLIAFIIFMIFAYIGVLIWMRRRRAEAQRQKKAEIQNEFEGKPKVAKKPKQEKKPTPQHDDFEPVAESASFSSILDEYDDPLEANRLEDLLFEPEDSEEEFASFAAPMSGDDPLAELYEAREVAEKEQILQEDEEMVELASLLAGLGEEEIVYHTIADEAIAVQVDGGGSTFAQEQLSILRDEHDERLIVQIGDKAFRSLLDDAEAKSTFTKIMKELSGIILKEDDSTDLETTASNAAEYHEVSDEPVHVKLFSGAETTALELMSILRDERDSHLMLQIGATAYRSLAKEKQAKSSFTKTMKELAGIILTADDNPPQSKTKSSPKPSLQPYQPVSDKVSRIIEDSQKELYGEEIPGVINIPKMDDLPPTHSVGRFGQIKVQKAEEVPELNIAEAIEKYLQYKIERAPQFQRRDIHIRPALSGGVTIIVDGKMYDFVDEIEDADARAFIQQAINEWQDQH